MGEACPPAESEFASRPACASAARFRSLYACCDPPIRPFATKTTAITLSTRLMGAHKMARINEVGRRIAIASLSGFLASFVACTATFAQAGSTGGTIGKQDKSISGDGEAPSISPHARKNLPPRPAKPNEGADSACGRMSANIVGTWNSSSPSSVSADIRQTGCDFSGRITAPLFNHAVSGRYLGGSNYSITITRTNQITGCTTVMFGSTTVISAAQMQWVITGTDGKCDLPANYTETRLWTR